MMQQFYTIIFNGDKYLACKMAGSKPYILKILSWTNK